jgi:hypothetical protein
MTVQERTNQLLLASLDHFPPIQRQQIEALVARNVGDAGAEASGTAMVFVAAVLAVSPAMLPILAATVDLLRTTADDLNRANTIEFLEDAIAALEDRG